MALILPADVDSAYTRAHLPVPDVSEVMEEIGGAISGYLDYEPSLTLHQHEEGMVTSAVSGSTEGMYRFALRHRPLVNGDATVVFQSLSLLYPVGETDLTTETLALVRLRHDTGVVLCPAYGSVVGGLATLFGYTPALFGTGVVNYVATYAAGYKTGIDDPVQPNGLPYDAPPLPKAIRRAATLLLQERVGYDAQVSQSPGSPVPGAIRRQKFGLAEIEYAAPPTGQGMAQIGYGSPLSRTAQTLLRPYRRRFTPTIV